MAKRDYYEILELSRTASDDDIKRAYRKLAVKFHPDRNAGDKSAEEKFKEVNEAYQVLSDPQKRAAYDQFGHAGMSGPGGFGGGGFEQGFGNFNDIFDNIFGDIFGGGRSRRRGVDLRYNLDITFEEAAFGVEKVISFEKETTCQPCEGTGARPGTKPIACGTCEGTGQVRLNQGFFTLTRPCTSCGGQGVFVRDGCKHCGGSGKAKQKHSVSVNIPAGIDTDQKLRLKDEGESSEPGGPPGDLYVIVRVQDHALFNREGEHVLLDLPISFVQAALGTEMEVPTLSGPIQIKIKPGTQTGNTLRLRGKGIKRLNGAGYGDQHIHITVETPQKLTSRQKELLKEFEREGSTDSLPGVSTFINKFKEMFKV